LALADHARNQDWWAKRRRKRAALPEAFGNFLAGLVLWSWFITISFRDGWRNEHRPKDRPSPRSGPPCPDEGLAYIAEWLADIQADALPNTVGWLIAEEFGRLGGRWHCHGLICGVAHLNREFWWKEAFRRFGRTRIEPFDPERAACFYAAKYAAKTLGEIHLGGTFAGVQLSRMMHKHGRRIWDDSLAVSSAPTHTHGIVVPSATMERKFFRPLRRWHR